MLTYITKAFYDLTLDELYRIMVLRQEVFVVEQDCAYLDADDKDQLCHHVLGYDSDNIIQAYTRLVPKGVSYPEYNSIGRVITSAKVRRTGTGKIIMQKSIEAMSQLYSDEVTKISAQVYALPFYSSLGFITHGPIYDEDGIPHQAMLLIK